MHIYIYACVCVYEYVLAAVTAAGGEAGGGGGDEEGIPPKSTVLSRSHTKTYVHIVYQSVHW